LEIGILDADTILCSGGLISHIGSTLIYLGPIPSS